MTLAGRIAERVSQVNEHPARESLKVQLDYTNWKGVRGPRVIIPLLMTFGTNVWHREPQWLLYALDCEKNEERSFAMRDIHSWSMYHG